VDDFLSDEKLVFCSAAATGVYIRLMCLMHKSEEYGKILLKQKFKQTLKQNESSLKNFASQLAVQLPYDYHTILFALEELVSSKVLQEEPCAISQRRMVKDNEISEKRSLSGRMGGDRTLGKKRKIPPENSVETENFASNFAQANSQANAGNGIVYGNNNTLLGGGMGEPAKSGEAADGDELSFEHAWELYGRKGNKKTAMHRWANLKNHFREAALKHIPAYVASTPERKYRKDFGTYLNQEAWNDEIIPHGPPGKKHPAVDYGNNGEFDEERWRRKTGSVN
jgi:hypothetical protein